MKKSILLYLLIFSVLTNLFTYMYFTKKNKSETESETVVLNDSLSFYKNDYNNLYNNYLDLYPFTLQGNDKAQDYFENPKTGKYFPYDKLNPFVISKLIEFNDLPEGNPYTGQIKMGEQKFIINKALLLNHRWIIANYSNGELWGDVLLKYFINEDETVTFELMQSWLYSK